MNVLIAFFKKLNPLVYTGAFLLLALIQTVLTKYLFLNSDPSHLAYLNLLINIAFDICLWGLFIRRYQPDNLRILIMAGFLAELVIGLFMKRMMFPFSNEITLIGLLGVLFTWVNTHMNRKKFKKEEN